MPLVSVVVPCHNYGRFLPDLVQSILKQTLQDFEVIIVDDASTDNTLDFCMDVMLMDKRVKALRLDKNAGKPTANNVGMTLAKGEYITILDADDMLAERSLELLHKACADNPHKFAYTDMVLYVNGEKQQKTWIFPEYDFNVLLDHNIIHTGIMFERRAFEDTGGYPTEFSFGREDWAFNILLGTKGYCGVHVPYPGYIYRREGQNRTLTNTDQSFQARFTDMIHSRFQDLYNGRFPMGCCGQRYPVNSQPDGSAQKSMSLVGSEGMTAVEYLGGNFGTTTFYGPVTGTAYKFDASDNRIKMVDNRDLSTDSQKGLLDLREHTKRIFTIASTQPVIPAPAIPEDDKVVGIEEIVGKDSATFKKLSAAGLTDPNDIKDYSVEELIAKTGLSKTAAKALLGSI